MEVWAGGPANVAPPICVFLKLLHGGSSVRLLRAAFLVWSSSSSSAASVLRRTFLSTYRVVEVLHFKRSARRVRRRKSYGRASRSVVSDFWFGVLGRARVRGFCVRSRRAKVEFRKVRNFCPKISRFYPLFLFLVAQSRVVCKFATIFFRAPPLKKSSFPSKFA